jgi:Restriction Endonuclease associating with ARP
MSQVADPEAWDDYFRDLHSIWWDWAEANVATKLDMPRQPNRPPVFKDRFAPLNVIASPDPAIAEMSRSLIPRHQWHKSFASMRSSQAIAQSVFGALIATKRLELLAELKAECGRPAFEAGVGSWTAELEFEVDWLNEPRPTSVDVFFRGPDYSIAVECKFTERDFGQCSRPSLSPGSYRYEEKYCDGSFTRQQGRKARCSLTEAGVKYWDHLPRLFEWYSDRDLNPCPFRSTFQLARNALAACSNKTHSVDPKRGHALIIYDARNPEFRPGGKADGQWQEAQDASLAEGLLRKISWQKLVSAVSTDPDLDWLVQGLDQLHGIRH